MTPPPSPNRRTFLKRTAVGLLGGAVGVGGYAWLVEPYWIEVVRRDLLIRFLPDALIGKTLVQISDLHIGPEVSDSYLRDAFKTISQIGPDILVVTGDFMTCKRDEELDHVCRVLEGLPPTRLATIGILGNHDYTRSHRVTDVADRLTRRLTDLGLRMLRNASCDVSGLTISGADDLWSGRCDIDRVTLKLDNDKANLFLLHNPDAADGDVWEGYQGWILCGHTHGGQVKPPFLRPPFTSVTNPRYVEGEVDLYDGRRLYINRGLGVVRYPVRFNARPEITVFTLRRGAV
jgi:predicted MPP superfamily phosphohydrolase